MPDPDDYSVQNGLEPNSRNTNWSLAISARRTADATERAADAIVEYIVWLKARDAFTSELHKQMEEQYKEANLTFTSPKDD